MPNCMLFQTKTDLLNFLYNIQDSILIYDLFQTKTDLLSFYTRFKILFQRAAYLNQQCIQGRSQEAPRKNFWNSIYTLKDANDDQSQLSIAATTVY